LSRIGAAAARRRFTPEFINRLDRMVVFKPLGGEELRRVLDIELEAVQKRLENATGPEFQFSLAGDARELLLSEGTDSRYGARHLKRAIERLLVHPLSSLMCSGQIRHGDYIQIRHEPGASSLSFFREAAVRDAARAAGPLAA
jgi:ATP-dependent Clp protease ATP-binding subunit ClpA